MINSNNINRYRNMWILVFFDLPTSTKKERKEAQRFRKRLLDDGFSMFQFSIYIRNCPSRENADVHIRRVKNHLPPKGNTGILKITDKQFEMLELFQGKEDKEQPPVVQQLELF